MPQSVTKITVIADGLAEKLALSPLAGDVP